MALKYYYRVGDVRGGSTILPVTGDPTYTITEMAGEYTIGNVALVFLDSSGNPATPTAGTVRFEASPIDGIWLEPPEEMTIDASEVIAADDGTATYTLPSFDGPVVATRMILSGVSGGGVTSVQAYHWRASA